MFEYLKMRQNKYMLRLKWWKCQKANMPYPRRVLDERIEDCSRILSYYDKLIRMVEADGKG